MATTFVCTDRKEDAGPNNNWMRPADARQKLTGLYRGAMKGRTMYVVPFLMGPKGSRFSKVGVEITDSKYLVLNMRIMTRVGQVALDHLGQSDDFTRCLPGPTARRGGKVTTTRRRRARSTGRAGPGTPDPRRRPRIRTAGSQRPQASALRSRRSSRIPTGCRSRRCSLARAASALCRSSSSHGAGRPNGIREEHEALARRIQEIVTPADLRGRDSGM
jgi:hypothetical protein